MKQLIVPIAIIIALITFFIVVDCKEFSRHDDVQTVQSESPTTNKKPTVSVPEMKPITEVKPTVEAKPVVEIKPVAEAKPNTDPKPAGTKPVDETKPAEVKPIAETKPAETKPVAETQTDKPAETKPQVQTNLEEKLLPAAVPVVTAEEAEKLNAEAMEYAIAEQDRREPFRRLYQNNKLNEIRFEGTINAVSSVPIPSENDYNDCLYSVFIELESFIVESSTGKVPPKEIIVNIPIMKDKMIINDNKFDPGDKIFIEAAEYDAMPQEIQEIQLSDDIQSFEHQYYFAKTIRRIASFSERGCSDFASREISILPIQTLPKDEKAALLRKERIQNEIAKIEEEIKKHGGSFENWKEEYKSIANKYSKLREDGFRGWIGNAYFSAAGSETQGYKTKQYISDLIPYKKYLEEQNIDLIVVRIPSKWDFAARVLASDDFQENPVWIEHYYECLKNDIEIIDPMQEMWKERFEHPLFYFYQVDAEVHPFEGMYLPTARLLSDILSRYNFQNEDNISLGDTFFGTGSGLATNCLYYPKGNIFFCENENPRQLSFKCLLLNKEKIGRLKLNSGSPFVCVSASMFGYPAMQDQGASLPHYLSYYLQHMVDWKYQSGSGNTILQNLLSDRYSLNKRKAVILMGNFGQGFPCIPKYLVDNAEKINLIETINFESIQKTNNDSFESQIQNGVSMVKAKQTKIRFEIEIPPMPNLKTCMIRINIPVFLTPNKSFVSVFDSNDKELDSTSCVEGKNLKCDLFVPAPGEQQKMSVVITPNNKGFYFAIKNIELWGF